MIQHCSALTLTFMCHLRVKCPVIVSVVILSLLKVRVEGQSDMHVDTSIK